MRLFEGVPELVGHVALLRYLLLGIVVIWSVLALRAPRWAVLAAGLLFCEAATGFWVASLSRPYGLLEDAAVTRRAGEAAVAAATGRAGESLVAGEQAAYRGFVALLKAGVPEAALVSLPSLLPALAVAAVALLAFALWARRSDALAGACLWLAFATGDLDAARGMGFLPATWTHPEEALCAVALAALALAGGRLWPRLGAPLAAALALLSLAVPAPSSPPRLADALLLLTLDQGAWLLLAALGTARIKDPTSVGLCLGGALAVLAASAAGAPGAYAAFALFRLGVLLASAAALSQLAREASPRLERLRAVAPERAALALALAIGAPGSFLAWWDPPRTDPVARASLEPISPALSPLMSYIRLGTPRDAVFVASADYAPAVAVLGGRRVLRAPSVLESGDDERRLRAEGALLAGRELPAGAADHGARFLLLAPGDFRARGIARPEDLEGRPGFRTRYADADGYRVYEVVR